MRTLIGQKPMFYLRHRKHVPCFFYWVIETRVEVWENEKCCGNTSRRRVFPQPFENTHGHLRTLKKCTKHSPPARVFYISLVFSNGHRVLSQCNARLKLLYLLSKLLTGFNNLQQVSSLFPGPCLSPLPVWKKKQFFRLHYQINLVYLWHQFTIDLIIIITWIGFHEFLTVGTIH